MFDPPAWWVGGVAHPSLSLGWTAEVPRRRGGGGVGRAAPHDALQEPHLLLHRGQVGRAKLPQDFRLRRRVLGGDDLRSSGGRARTRTNVCTVSVWYVVSGRQR